MIAYLRGRVLATTAETATRLILTAAQVMISFTTIMPQQKYLAASKMILFTTMLAAHTAQFMAVTMPILSKMTLQTALSAATPEMIISLMPAQMFQSTQEVEITTFTTPVKTRK